MKRKKFYITTTIASTLYFFRGQPRIWKEQFDVYALSAEKNKLKAFAAEEGIGYHYLPMRREISLMADFMCLLRFIWIFLKEKPYVVHGNTPKASFLSMVAAWITRRPVRIYMCHGLRYQGTQGKLRKLLMAMESISCACATHVICVSRGVADTMIIDGLCKMNKVSVVGYGSACGVDIDKFDPQKVESNIRLSNGIPEDAFVFTFIGRIVKDKGVNELVYAFEKLCQLYENIHLLLVGSNEIIQNPIDNRAFSLIRNNDRIHAVGAQEDVRPFLKASDVFVLPSYREGFGMVLIEAGAMGLPCITTNISGCNEIIIPGENGAIIEPQNEDALFNEMRLWIEKPCVVKELSSHARGLVQEKYDCSKVREKYWEFYKTITS